MAMAKKGSVNSIQQILDAPEDSFGYAEPSEYDDSRKRGADHSDSPEFQDEKRAKRLMRNREAARRNRLKKKNWINCLKESTEKAKGINEKLKAKVNFLKQEYSRLQVLIDSVNSNGKSNHLSL